MRKDYDYFHVTSYGDKLIPGKSLKLDHALYFDAEKADISELAALPPDELHRLRDNSAHTERQVYDELLNTMHEWERHAGRTLLIDKAIEYLNVPAVAHSSNQWNVDEDGEHFISNKVYMMNWRFSVETRYDREKQASVPAAWHLTWDLRTRAPKIGADYKRGERVAGQEKKRFTDKAAMEKYLEGRIAAYAHLFTELSPPIPRELANSFKVNNLLLPGYTIAEDGAVQHEHAAPAAKQPEGEKPSVLGRIAEAREEQRRAAENREKTAPGKVKPSRGKDEEL